MLSQASAVPETTTLEGDDALETLRRTGWGSLMAATIRRFRAADGFSHTRALAYQVTLTVIPALIGFVGLAASLEWATLKSVLETTVTDLAPGPAGSALAKAIEQGSEASGATAVVGLAAALVAGTTAMGQIERGANRIYGDPDDRPTLAKYGNAFVLACSSGVLLSLAFLALLAGTTIGDAGKDGGWSDTLVTVWLLARWPLGLAFVIIGFALLFKRAPRRSQPDTSWLSSGSAVSVLLWLAGTALLALYVGFSDQFGSTYGPLAGFIGLLLWAFLSSLALYLGVAFAAQLEAVRAGADAPRESVDGQRSAGGAEAAKTRLESTKSSVR